MQTHPVLTVDLEEWFHVCGHPEYSEPGSWDQREKRVYIATQRILQALSGSGSLATFFVLGWVARKHPALVREISSAGHEIACHGDLHKRVLEMTLPEFREDLRTAKRTLEDVTGRATTAFRAPEWSLRTAANPAFEVLVEEGFTVDSSLMGVPPLGPKGLPRKPFFVETLAGPILEVPPLTGTFLAIPAMMGGGWTARTSREARVVRAIETALQKEEFPVLYFHPWEFDPAHPKMSLSFVPRLVHFAGTSRVPGRFQSLLSKFRFVRIQDVSSAFPCPKSQCRRGVAA